MRSNLSILVLVLCLITSACSYGVQLSMSTATTASITNFYQDFSYCSCDLSPSLCDNYCCCDGACSTTTVAAWTAARSCLTASRTLQDFCNETSTKGFGVWSDLACVYQSNRGEIGYYYQYPDAASITYPSVNKFASISPNTVTQEFQSAASGVSLGSPYSTSNPYLSATSSTFFFAPQPGPGGVCLPSALNITSTSTSRCSVTPSAANCASLNSYYSGSICLNGQCTTSSTAQTITASSVSGTVCNGVLTGLTVAYTIASTGSSYSLSGVSITPTYSNVNFGSTVVVTVSQTATTPSSNSGNPGYQLGKPLTISPVLSAVGNPTTGVCYTTAGASGSLVILFGQSASYSCTSPSPCSTSYYIDSLLTSTITIQKYASKSAAVITVSGTGATLNGCSSQSYSLEIVYSYDGWQLDPQYYIVGARLVPRSSPDSISNPGTKYLQINWVYVNPLTVNTPPNNLFYTYFSKLWTPLKQQFGLS